MSTIAVFNLRYLSQKLSVCSCIKWPIHQMLSTQVLRRVVYSAERLPGCPLPKIIRIIGIKPVLSCTEWMENKSMYFWLCHSLEHRDASNNATSALKHMYKPVKIYFFKCTANLQMCSGREGHSKSWWDKPLVQQTTHLWFRYSSVAERKGLKIMIKWEITHGYLFRQMYEYIYMQNAKESAEKIKPH